MSVNSFVARIVDGARPCYGCNSPSKQPLCVACRGSIQNGPFILSELQSAAVLRSPITDRLINQFQKTGHHNTLTPWIPPMKRALPEVPTVLCVDRNDPFIWRLAARLCQECSHLALSRTPQVHLKSIQLVGRPVIEADQPTVAVLTH